MRKKKLSRVSKGLKRVLAAVDTLKTKKPITRAMILQLIDNLEEDASNPTFIAMMCTAYWFGLRIQAYTDGQLRYKHWTWLETGGSSLEIQPDKTFRVPRTRSATASNDAMDLLTVHLAYVKTRGGVSDSSPLYERPVKVRDSTVWRPATNQWFNSTLQAAIKQTFGCSEGFSAHSIRAGLCTDLVMANVPDALIREHIGWVNGSKQLDHYFKVYEINKMSASKAVLQLSSE